MYNMPDIRKILETPLQVQGVQKTQGLMRRAAEEVAQEEPYSPQQAILGHIQRFRQDIGEEGVTDAPDEDNTSRALRESASGPNPVQSSVVPRPRSSTATDVGKKLLDDLMRDFDLTRAQAAGFVGNLDHETGGFKFMQEIEPVVPGSRGGYGFAQWTASRRVAFEDWAAEKGLPLDSYEANYGFLKHELENTSEGSVLESLRQAQDVRDAATIVSKEYLRPGIPNLGSRTFRATVYNEGQK